MFFPPILIASIKINFSFSKRAIDDEDAPKSIQIAPKILSSEFNVAKADDKGVGT